MINHQPGELAETEIQISHPDNEYRLGKVTIWHSRQEGAAIEIEFGRVSDDLPGEYVMAVTTFADLITLHRELGELIELSAEWPQGE